MGNPIHQGISIYRHYHEHTIISDKTGNKVRGQCQLQCRCRHHVGVAANVSVGINVHVDTVPVTCFFSSMQEYFIYSKVLNGTPIALPQLDFYHKALHM